MCQQHWHALCKVNDSEGPQDQEDMEGAGSMDVATLPPVLNHSLSVAQSPCPWILPIVGKKVYLGSTLVDVVLKETEFRSNGNSEGLLTIGNLLFTCPPPTSVRK